MLWVPYFWKKPDFILQKYFFFLLGISLLAKAWHSATEDQRKLSTLQGLQKYKKMDSRKFPDSTDVGM